MSEALGRRSAYWTFDKEAQAYYFAPTDRTPPPYRTQKHVTAILDIAADGTLAGIELIQMGAEPLPSPPSDSQEG
jgi:hypothetical protein